jgi:hypothetical protein
MRIEIVNKPEIKKRKVVGILQNEDNEENSVFYEEGDSGHKNTDTEIDKGESVCRRKDCS